MERVEISPQFQVKASANASASANCCICNWPADCMRQTFEGLIDLLRFSGCCGSKEKKRRPPTGKTPVVPPNPVRRPTHTASGSPVPRQPHTPNTGSLFFYPDKSDLPNPRRLEIGNYEDPIMWTEIPLQDDPSFERAAVMQEEFNFYIKATVEFADLSHGTYDAYLIFKFADISEGFDSLKTQVATVAVHRNNNRKNVCLATESVNREDGWQELRLGSFIKEEGANGRVGVKFGNADNTYQKSGLMVAAIEIRASAP